MESLDYRICRSRQNYFNYNEKKTLTSHILEKHKEFISDVYGVDIGRVFLVDSLESHLDAVHFHVVLRQIVIYTVTNTN